MVMPWHGRSIRRLIGIEASPVTVEPSVGSSSLAGHAFEMTKLFLVATDAVGKKSTAVRA